MAEQEVTKANLHIDGKRVVANNYWISKYTLLPLLVLVVLLGDAKAKADMCTKSEGAGFETVSYPQNINI